MSKLRKVKQIGQRANWNSTIISLPLTLCYPTVWTLWSASLDLSQKAELQRPYFISTKIFGSYLLAFLILVNLEVTQVLILLAVSSCAQPITWTLLQIVFGERFQRSFGEKKQLRSYSDPALAPFSGYNPSTEIPRFAIRWDSLLKKRLNIGSVRDSIFYRAGAVKGKLQNLLGFFWPPLPQVFSQAPLEAERAIITVL